MGLKRGEGWDSRGGGGGEGRMYGAYIVPSPSSKSKDAELGIGRGHVPVSQASTIGIADGKGGSHQLNHQHKVPLDWRENLQHTHIPW